MERSFIEDDPNLDKRYTQKNSAMVNYEITIIRYKYKHFKYKQKCLFKSQFIQLKIQATYKSIFQVTF